MVQSGSGTSYKSLCDVSAARALKTPSVSPNHTIIFRACVFQFRKRYKLTSEGLTHTAVMLLGKQKYQGTGFCSEAARRQVDYYALQQTTYTFNNVPPSVITGKAVSTTRSSSLGRFAHVLCRWGICFAVSGQYQTANLTRHSLTCLVLVQRVACPL